MDSDAHIKVPITKIDDEKRLVFGFANVAVSPDGETVTDLHGDQIPADVLEKAAYEFVLYYRTGGLEHSEMGVASLVESVFLTPEKLSAMGVNDPAFNGAAWFLGFKVHDPGVWAMVKDGQLSAFSIGGVAKVQEIAE